MMKTVWKQILHSLEKSLNPGLFTVWIKPLYGKVEGNKLILSAPNEFVANWVRDRLLQVIREAAASVMGVDPKIIINVEVRKNTKPATKKTSVQKTAVTSSSGQMGLPIVQGVKPLTAKSWRFSLMISWWDRPMNWPALPANPSERVHLIPIIFS